ncbi:MAG: hypothetical protein RLZZ118_857 [Bacteroidota bacterium]|jgi:DNA polymerase-3 subunit epsilon
MIVAFILGLIAIFISSLLSNKSKNTNNKPNGNILIIDTETNGLPINRNGSLTDLNNWPRIVSISWNKISSNGENLSKHSFVIKPEGFHYLASAISIHKITEQDAILNGLPIINVLELLMNDIKDSKFIVAHNIDFDYPVVYSEFSRANLDIEYIEKLDKICTMKLSKSFCAITTPYGYKYPTLDELHFKLFKTNLQNKHNSKLDVDACTKCFKELYNLKIIKF